MGSHSVTCHPTQVLIEYIALIFVRHCIATVGAVEEDSRTGNDVNDSFITPSTSRSEMSSVAESHSLTFALTRPTVSSVNGTETTSNASEVTTMTVVSEYTNEVPVSVNNLTDRHYQTGKVVIEYAGCKAVVGNKRALEYSKIFNASSDS